MQNFATISGGIPARIENPSSRSANFVVARFPNEEDDGQGGRKFFIRAEIFGQKFECFWCSPGDDHP